MVSLVYLSVAGLTLLCLFQSGFGFSLEPKGAPSVSALSDSNESRRSFFSTITTTAAAVASGISSPLLTALPANAVGGASKVGAKLAGYGLPPLGRVPDGFSPLLEVYGKGKNRFPILVQFAHPITWVVVVPSNDVNGEDGTVQAGDYGKGDTATFYLYDGAGKVKDLHEKPQSFYETAIIKAISQKGDNMYQSFKVIKSEKVDNDGKQYVIADFKYELLTGAGFIVERRGVASITSQGGAVEVLWTAVTNQRYKKMEATLRDITASFRCYADGLNLSDEIIKEAEPDF